MLDHDRRIGTTGLDEDAALIPDLSNGLIDRSIYTDPEIYRLELRGSSPAAGTSCATRPRSPTRATTSSTTSARTRSSSCATRTAQVQRAAEHLPPPRQRAVPRRAGQRQVVRLQLPRLELRPGRAADRRSGEDDLLPRRPRPAAAWGWRRRRRSTATWASASPPCDPTRRRLHDYLGEVGRTGIGRCCAYGEVVVLDGVQKNVIDCNWKIAVDNLFDWYHVKVQPRLGAQRRLPRHRAHDDARRPRW